MSKQTKTKVVYVIGVDGLPLDPTNPAKARILLKNGKTKVKNIYKIKVKL